MEPGYGWSSPPPLDRGFNMDDCARLLDKLMQGLGFGDGYAVQGGDIGSGLARTLALKYDGCKCINVNYLPAVAPPPGSPERKQLKPHEEKSLQRSEQFQATGRGYAIEHATRPSTIGALLLDIVESFSSRSFVPQAWSSAAHPSHCSLGVRLFCRLHVARRG